MARWFTSFVWAGGLEVPPPTSSEHHYVAGQEDD